MQRLQKMATDKVKWLKTIFPLLDSLSIIFSWLAAIYIRFGDVHQLPPFRDYRSYLFFLSLLLGSNLFLLFHFGTYKTVPSSIVSALKSALTSFLIVNIVSFYLKSIAFSRLVLVIFFIFQVASFVLWRSIFELAIRPKMLHEAFRKRLAILGLGRDALSVLKHLEDVSCPEYEIVGFISYGEIDLKPNDISSRPVLGNVLQLNKVIQDFHLDDIVVTQDSSYLPTWLRHVDFDRSKRTRFHIVPNELEIFVSKTHLDSLTGIPLIEFLIEPISGWSKLTKRLTDFAVSSVLLLMSVPIILIIVFLIKRDAPGSTFYVQTRVGKGGKPFKMYKFRSMVDDAEYSTGPVWADANDQRITKVGRFLRQSGLDEIPQLWNVLIGEMSLVGPRPERQFFIEQYPELATWRLSVKPGLTGLAQINGRYHLSVDEKVRYDLYYISNHSFFMDMEILWKTLLRLLGNNNSDRSIEKSNTDSQIKPTSSRRGGAV